MDCFPELSDGAVGHSQSSPKPIQNAKRRRTTRGDNPGVRVAVACQACRERKTRCSGEHPTCNFCQKTEIECVYEYQGNIGAGGLPIPQNLLDDWGSKILSEIERLAARLDSVASPNRNIQDDLVSDVASRRSILAPAMQGSSDPDDSLQSNPQNGITSIYGDEDAQGSGSMIESLSLRRSMACPENAPFGLWWSYTIEETLSWPILEFHGNISIGLDALMDSSDEDEEGNGKNCRVVQSNSVGKTQRQKHTLRSLDESTIVFELIEDFLESAHAMNPILDPADLRKHAANMIEHGLSWDGETCLVLLACAIGAIADPWDCSRLIDFSRPKASPERHALGQEYFNAAQKRLGRLWAHCSVISAQCLFMTGVFLSYTQEPVAAWRAFNSASVACRSYISKRVARRNKGLPQLDNEDIEQRLCWSCIKSEREIAVEFGMETSGLNIIAHSSSLPTPPNGYASDINSAITEQDNRNIATIPSHYEDRSWYYYLTEIMLQKLEMQIDIYTQGKRREAYRRPNDAPESFFASMIRALKEFDYQLTLYYKSLPPTMRFPIDDLTPCTDELRQHLRWRVYSVRHDITVPALYILLHNDTTHWNRNLAQDLVRLANICLALDEKFLSMAISTHRNQATWLGPRKGVRSALIIIAAARLTARQLPGLEQLSVPENALWEDGGKTLVKGLKYWSEESRDCKAYIEILRQLHTAFG